MYEIHIRNGKKGRTYKYRGCLFENGFKFNKEKKYFYKEFSSKEAGKYKGFCLRKGLKFEVINLGVIRSHNYRNIYFENNEHRYYFCTYCGRILTRECVTVDHIFSINATSKSMKLEKRMKANGIEDVNDEKNLCAACKSCNSKKGSKAGIWIYRGLFGKHRTFAYIRWGIRLIVLLVALFFLTGHFMVFI